MRPKVDPPSLSDVEKCAFSALHSGLCGALCNHGFQSIAVVLSRFWQRERPATQWIASSAGCSATVSVMVSRDLIDQAGKLLAETAGAESKVILFGSHARGEARADSDVDFLVIEPVVKNRLEEWERLRRTLRDFPAPVDIVVLDEKRAERRAKVPGTVVHHALRDGCVLAHA